MDSMALGRDSSWPAVAYSFRTVSASGLGAARFRTAVTKNSTRELQIHCPNQIYRRRFGGEPNRVRDRVAPRCIIGC